MGRAKHAAAALLSVDGRDQPSVTLDVPHDDGWAHFDGLEAMQAASTMLGGANHLGASSAQIAEAVKRVEELGDATEFLISASSLGGSRGARMVSVLNLWRQLGTLRPSSIERLATEMALHEARPTRRNRDPA